jgi:hypothetical protein
MATSGAVTDNWQAVPTEPTRHNRRWDDIKHDAPAAITQHMPVTTPAGATDAAKDAATDPQLAGPSSQPG